MTDAKMNGLKDTCLMCYSQTIKIGEYERHVQETGEVHKLAKMKCPKCGRIWVRRIDK